MAFQFEKLEVFVHKTKPFHDLSCYYRPAQANDIEKMARFIFDHGTIRTIYIDRHEENAASAGRMRKVHFVEADTFSDPDRRFVGLRKTTVLRFQF